MRQACVSDTAGPSGLNPPSVQLIVELAETDSVGVRTYLHFCIL